MQRPTTTATNIRLWEKVSTLDEFRHLAQRERHLSGRLAHELLLAAWNNSALVEIFALTKSGFGGGRKCLAAVAIAPIDKDSGVYALGPIASVGSVNRRLLRSFRCCSYDDLRTRGARQIVALSAANSFGDIELLTRLGFVGGVKLPRYQFDTLNALFGWKGIIHNVRRVRLLSTTFAPALLPIVSTPTESPAEIHPCRERIAGELGLRSLIGHAFLRVEWERDDRSSATQGLL